MQIPYTYYIFHPATGSKYYGARYAKDCHPSDLWTKYFTSSKKIHALIKIYGKESFIVEVRKTFDTSDEALNWEEKVLTRLKVTKSDIWLNGHIRGKKFKTVGKRPGLWDKNQNALVMLSDHGKKQYAIGNSGVGKYTDQEKAISAVVAKYGVANVFHLKAECPHCGKIGQRSALIRWHFDNCSALK
jgi:hypothetical protein